MKTILVTGAAGFIGSNLCLKLFEKNQVIGVDNFISGQRQNVADLRKKKNFRFIGYDIIKPFKPKRKIAEVWNLACPASPPAYYRYPIETLLASSLGVKNMLDLALRKKAKFFHTSTSEVYGDPLEHPQKESYWGHVNPIGPRSCFSADTEILTKEGWKLFKDLSRNDGIATLNENGFLVEYQKPAEIIEERYIGELIRFTNSKIDLLVTPNHKMYVKQRNKGKYRLVEAFESIRWERAESLKSGSWIGKEKKFFYLPLVRNAKTKQQEKISMDVWLEFFGYFITEGCTYLNKKQRVINDRTYKSNIFTVLVSQSKKIPQKRNRIKQCLKKLGFKFYEENAQFRILSKQLYTYLQKFGKSKDRYVPSNFLMLSRRQLKILFDAMMLGDGSSDGRRFYSSSERLLGNMQEILLKLGMAGTISIKDKSRNTRVVFILTDKSKDFLTPLYPKRAIEKYNGFVYCVTVPNHTLYVRRNGKALWCGNCYDEGKRFAESLIENYRKKYRLETKIVRIFNTYGPRMRADDGRVISNFIVQALLGKNLTIYGDGSQTRSFCFIDDMVEGLMAMMESKEHGPINLGNPQEFTIRKLASLVIKLTNSKSKIVYKPLPKDDPKQRRPDINLAGEKLGWEPKIGLEEGLRRTIEYFRKIV